MSDHMKRRSIAILILAEAAGMIPWFATAAVLPDMLRATEISAIRQALLSSSVQAGFVVGALAIAILQLSDRWDPRHLFCGCAIGAALTNAALVVVPIGSDAAVILRFLTGALLAGVYPVGMKIVVGWGTSDRGLLVGLLVAALTFGKSGPYFLAWLGGTEWQSGILASSAIALLGGLAILATNLGPYHTAARGFDPRAIVIAWRDRRIRAAYLGYFGHMWELFAFWAWAGAAATASYAMTMDSLQAESLGKLTAFLAIACGAPGCIIAGRYADRIGKAEVAILAMIASASLALLTAFSFGGPIWITFILMILWGIAIIPDSAQFSALSADFAPPHLAGSILTLQTAIGFALTFFTVQLTPVLAQSFGWPVVLAGLAIGPVLGIAAMLPLRLKRSPWQ